MCIRDRSLSEYIENCGIVNPNLIFVVDKEAEMYTLDNFIQKMMAVSSVEELIDLAIQNEKQFFSCYKTLIEHSNDINMRLVQACLLYTSQVLIKICQMNP